MALATQKSLGQHWLHDARVIDRMVRDIDPAPDEPVIEIGPGTGALTRALLATGATVTAIELDERCWPLLEELSAANGGRLAVIRGDALQVDWPKLLDGVDNVVGNLPYNVGTEIVATLVTQPRPPRMTFMLQKEVVQRICAKPDTRDWGRLGVLCDLYCERKSLFDVSPGCFSPPPKVMSAIVRLTPRPAPLCAVDPAKLDKLLRLVFGQRRKMLRSVLKGVVGEEAMRSLGIEPTLRGEVLGTQQLCKLAQHLPK